MDAARAAATSSVVLGRFFLPTDLPPLFPCVDLSPVHRIPDGLRFRTRSCCSQTAGTLARSDYDGHVVTQKQ
jgi:hypothetical protein